jgi:hypothetical protein
MVSVIACCTIETYKDRSEQKKEKITANGLSFPGPNVRQDLLTPAPGAYTRSYESEIMQFVYPLITIRM